MFTLTWLICHSTAINRTKCNSISRRQARITSLTQLKKIAKTMILKMWTSNILHRTSLTRSSSELAQRHSFIDIRNPRSFNAAHMANIHPTTILTWASWIQLLYTYDMTAAGSTLPVTHVTDGRVHRQLIQTIKDYKDLNYFFKNQTSG